MPSAWAPDMNSGDVLSAFHRDAPYLFLGAGFVAVGFVSAAFTALRRRRDSLRIFFSLFAVLYGLRLWISSALLGMTVHSASISFPTRMPLTISKLVIGSCCIQTAFWTLAIRREISSGKRGCTGCFRNRRAASSGRGGLDHCLSSQLVHEAGRRFDCPRLRLFLGSTNRNRVCRRLCAERIDHE